MHRPHHAPTPPANNLWIARKRVGYSQKWIATLLGHHSLSVVSEYEHGRKVPSLETALKLQAIYHTPVSELFGTLATQTDRQVAAAKGRHPGIQRAEQRAEEAKARLRELHGPEQTATAAPA